MKKLLFLALSMGFLSVAMGQLKPKVKCPDFYVDILNGTVNEMKPNTGWAEIKAKFPCSTSAEEESASSKCGGGVFFKNREIYFYTRRDCIGFAREFIGKLRSTLVGSRGGTRCEDTRKPNT